MTARCEHIKNVDVSEVAKSTISQRFLSTMLYRLNFDNTQWKLVPCTQQLAKEVQSALKSISNFARYK